MGSILTGYQQPPPPTPPPPPPPPSPTFDEPWRDARWGKRKEDLDYVKNFKPHSGAKHLRILLHGPAGAGKSSFFNSVDSTLQGKISSQAFVATAYGGSFTKEHKIYKIQREKPGTFYPFVFSDTMGLERSNQGGIHIDDIKLILKGKIREGYMFNPVSSLSEKDSLYNKKPTKNDKVSVLVCVVPANTPTVMDDKVVEKIKDVRDAASELGIPQIVILTKIDEACPEVKKDVMNVYKSKHIKKQMEAVSAVVGIPMDCIFPVKNYSSGNKTDDQMDSLILSVMRKIIDPLNG